MKSRHKYYNPNPKKREDACDCVVRALCKATGQDWNTVFIELSKLGIELKAMANSDVVWKEYMNRNGFKRISIKVTKGSKRPTVTSFSNDNRNGTYILQVAGHLVTVENGYFYDTWDCGNKSLYAYYMKEDK